MLTARLAQHERHMLTVTVQLERLATHLIGNAPPPTATPAATASSSAWSIPIPAASLPRVGSLNEFQLMSTTAAVDSTIATAATAAATTIPSTVLGVDATAAARRSAVNPILPSPSSSFTTNTTTNGTLSRLRANFRANVLRLDAALSSAAPPSSTATSTSISTPTAVSAAAASLETKSVANLSHVEQLDERQPASVFDSTNSVESATVTATAAADASLAAPAAAAHRHGCDGQPGPYAQPCFTRQLQQ